MMDVIVKRCAGLDVHKRTSRASFSRAPLGFAFSSLSPLDKFQEPLREPSLTGSKGRVYGT